MNKHFKEKKTGRLLIIEDDQFCKIADISGYYCFKTRKIYKENTFLVVQGKNEGWEIRFSEGSEVGDYISFLSSRVIKVLDIDNPIYVEQLPIYKKGAILTEGKEYVFFDFENDNYEEVTEDIGIIKDLQNLFRK